MAKHENDKTILGDGLKWNVRSYLFERVVDFSLMGKVDASAYYEIGTLPKGFVPRNVAVIELVKASSASTVKLYKTVEDASNGAATEIAGATVGGDNLAIEVKPFDKAVVASTEATVTPSLDAQLAIKAGAAFTHGKVKIAISGDLMTGYWDEPLETSGDFDPAEGAPVNTAS